MSKGNKIRIIFWGSICFLTLICFGVGIVFFYKGYGIKGAIRNDLKPVAEAFNNLSDIKKFSSSGIIIKANITDNKIVVTYNTGTSVSTFNYNYMEYAKQKILYVEYTNNDSINGNIVSKYMIDAVSVTIGHKENEIYDLYTFNDFQKSNILQGVNIIFDNSTYKIFINLDKSLIDSGFTVDNVINENVYLNNDDLTDLNDSLLKNKTYSISKGNINLYSTYNEGTYVIYLQDTLSLSDNLYNSLLSAIESIVTSEQYGLFKTNYTSLTENKSFDIFNIELNVNNDISKFNTDNNIIKITINK